MRSAAGRRGRRGGQFGVDWAGLEGGAWSFWGFCLVGLGLGIFYMICLGLVWCVVLRGVRF